MTQAQFPIGLIERTPTGGAIFSMEKVTLQIGGATTVTQALTKGQDPDQCVVFYSGHTNTGDDRLAYTTVRVDVYDNAGTPTLRVVKDGSAFTKYMHCTVLEFVPDISVQKISWSAPSSGSTAWTATIPTAVDQAKAFIINTYKSDSTGNYGAAEAYAVGVRFNSNTELGFYREGTPAHGMSGFAYVIEDKSAAGKYFAVQAVEISLGSTDTTKDGDLGAAVDLTATMLVAHHADANGGAYAFSSNIQLEFFDSDTVRATRSSSGTVNTITVFAVEWQNGTKVWTQTHTWTTASAGSVQTEADALATFVNAAVSMVFPAVMNGPNLSSGRPTSGAGTYVELDGMLGLDLDADGEGVTISHMENSVVNDWTCTYQVVELVFV
jgi:hypothetical protein